MKDDVWSCETTAAGVSDWGQTQQRAQSTLCVQTCPDDSHTGVLNRCSMHEPTVTPLKTVISLNTISLNIYAPPPVLLWRCHIYCVYLKIKLNWVKLLLSFLFALHFKVQIYTFPKVSTLFPIKEFSFRMRFFLSRSKVLGWRVFEAYLWFGALKINWLQKSSFSSVFHNCPCLHHSQKTRWYNTRGWKKHIIGVNFDTL